jgi:AraC family transcriptional regulator, transcriptional activator of pobA
MDKQFRIFELTKELVDDIVSKTIEPHFHDFEELIIVMEGSMEHYIDFEVETIKAPFACYISMGKMHRLIPQPDLRGWVINYKTEFIPDSKLNFYSNFFSSTRVSLSEGPCLKRFINLCEIIDAEYHQEFIDFPTIGNLVNALVSMIDAERKRKLPIENSLKDSQITAFNNFLKILEENFRRDEGVSFYSGSMNMSEKTLNTICKNNFQKSVSEIIETRKLIEAKHLLLHTDKSVSEIGYEVGYNEKSYFTRVFHNKLKLTPTRFREISRSVIS